MKAIKVDLNLVATINESEAMNAIAAEGDLAKLLRRIIANKRFGELYEAIVKECQERGDDREHDLRWDCWDFIAKEIKSFLWIAQHVDTEFPTGAFDAEILESLQENKQALAVAKSQKVATKRIRKPR